MAIVKAAVRTEGDKVYLEFALESGSVHLPISDDNPKEVKRTFNALIERTREGEFALELAEGGEDLFSQVAAEYIAQLNKVLHAFPGKAARMRRKKYSSSR